MSTNDFSLSWDTRPIVARLPQSKSVSPVWRRFVAFVLDGLILYAVGRGIGTTFFDSLSQLGPWGHLLGFCISLSYFATLDSSVGHGQTVGKRLLRLRVVGAQGNPISLGRSLVRFTVFAFPQFLNGLQLPREINPWIGSILLAVVVSGVGGSTLYLLIFNRHTRQGLHDLAAGSYVVGASDTGLVQTEPIWDTHWRVLRWFLTLLACLAVSGIVMHNKLEKSGPVFQSEEDVRLLEQLDQVQMARARYLKPIKWNDSLTKNPLAHKKTLVITVWWTGEPKAREAFSYQVAKLILQNDPMVNDQDLLWIVVARGYNLGIASGGNSQAFSHSPAEWRQHVFGTLPAQSPAPTH